MHEEGFGWQSPDFGLDVSPSRQSQRSVPGPQVRWDLLHMKKGEEQDLGPIQPQETTALHLSLPKSLLWPGGQSPSGPGLLWPGVVQPGSLLIRKPSVGTMVPTSGVDGPSVTCWACCLYQTQEQRSLVPAAWLAVFVQGEALPGTDAEQTGVPAS